MSNPTDDAFDIHVPPELWAECKNAEVLRNHPCHGEAVCPVCHDVLAREAFDWQVRAEKADQKCAELAAALDALMQDEYLQKRAASVRAGVGTATPYGKVIVGVLDSGYSAILAAYRARVERETLTQVRKCRPGEMYSTIGPLHGAGLNSGIQMYAEAIECQFATKEKKENLTELLKALPIVGTLESVGGPGSGVFRVRKGESDDTRD